MTIDCIDGALVELNEAEADAAAAAGFDALDSELTVISDFNSTEDNAAWLDGEDVDDDGVGVGVSFKVASAVSSKSLTIVVVVG